MSRTLKSSQAEQVMMSLTIEGKSADLRRLWYQERGINQIRREWRGARFCLAVDADSFAAALSGYDECVAELKRDDAITGTTDFFGRAGYPSLSELTRQSELLTQVVQTYFAVELFAALLPPFVADRGTFAICDIDSVRMSAGGFVIEGRCCEWPVSVGAENA